MFKSVFLKNSYKVPIDGIEIVMDYFDSFFACYFRFIWIVCSGGFGFLTCGVGFGG